MRLGWLGMVSCALLGGSSVTACGAAFSESNDGGVSGSDGSTTDGADDGDLLEGGEDGPGMTDATHRDALADGGADETAVDGAPGTDGATADTAAHIDGMAGMDSAPPADSAIDTGPVGDACTLLVATESNGIFVSMGGAASACGSKAVPCNSIQTAINVASSLSKPYVYVDNGTYVESLTLASNVTILGGWIDTGGTWNRQCGVGNAANVIVKAPPGSNKTIVANNVSGAAVDTLTVKSKDIGSVASGESIYGIFATQSSVVLTNVLVQVVKAGDGVGGASGTTGTAGANTCARTAASNGQDASSATNGGGAASPSFSIAGYTPTSGSDGSIGAPGNNGTAGVSAASRCATGTTCGYDTLAGLCFTDQPDQSCGTDGTEGCGGGPGTNGRGGSGGGSSIALYVWGGSVVTNVGTLAAGDSGAGGGGGGGGSGGAGGGAGVAGQAGPQIIKTCKNNPPTCGGNTFTSGGAGGGGGPGGKGATGGAGGGGAGGFSYSYYFGGGGAVTSNGTTLSFGIAGVGGSGTGPLGSAGPHN